MKKVISIVLAVVMCLSLAACGGNSAPENTVNSKEDLAGKTIGVQIGTTGDTVVAADYAANEGATVSQFNSGILAVQALKQGKVDCVIIDEEPAKNYVASNDGIKILEDTFEPEDYAICVKKGNTELLDKFNTALAELEADGTLQKIKDNYIGDNAGKTPYETPEGTEYPNGKLVMATNATFPPYEFIQDNKVVGIDADIAKAICDKLGYELEIIDMEFEGIIAAVDSGKADFGAAGMTVTEERLESVDFTNTYTTSKNVIIVRE